MFTQQKQRRLVSKPRRRSRAKPATIVIYDPETENILSQLKEKAPEIDRQARQDGGKNIPASDQRTYGDTELEIKAKFEGSLRDSLTSISQVVTNLQAQLATNVRLKELLMADPETAIKEAREQNNPLVQQLRALNDETDRKTKLLEKKKANLEHELEKDRTERRITEDSIGYIPRRKGWWAQLGYFLAFLFAALADVAVTFKNIEQTAKTTRITSLAIAIGIGLALAAIAHNFGKSIRTNNRKGMILSLVAALPFIATVGVLAIGYGSWITALINLAMFFGLTVVAYFHSEKEADLIEKYFKDEAAIRSGEKKIDRIEVKIHIVRTKVEPKKLRLVQVYYAKVVEEYNTLKEHLDEWQDYRDKVKDRFTALYHQQFHRYRSLNQKERIEKGIPLVMWWQENNDPPPLQTSQDKDDDHPIDPSDVPAGINGRPRKTGLTILPLLLFGVLALGSCKNFKALSTEGGVETKAYLFLDVTDDMKFDPIAAATAILKDLKLDTAEVYPEAITFEITALNDRYSNRTTEVKLEKGGDAFSEITKDRLACQGRFCGDVITALRKEYDSTTELANSRLYLPICEALRELQKSPAGRKCCFVFSDGLENTGDLSFYKYRQNPKRLLAEKDTIIKKFEKQCSLPDLTGIEIYIIYQPTKDLDELVYTAKLFWRDYFQSHGATVHLLVGV
jgi:hypothetical protein